MAKKKDKTYHLILVIEDETTLQSSDLVIDDVEKAKEMFASKIRENDVGASEQNISYALDEGWYKVRNTVIMYTEPFNVFGKE